MTRYKSWKTFLRISLAAFLVGLSCSCSSKPSQVEQYAPSDQLQFHQIRAGYAREYNAAKNDILKSEIYNEARQSIYQFVKSSNYRLSNWVGEVDSIKTPKGGDHVTVNIVTKLGGIKVNYTNVAASVKDAVKIAIFDERLIKPGSILYNQLSQLKEGDAVVFSGNMRLVSESWLERTQVQYPGLSVAFTDIRPLSEATKQVKAQAERPAQTPQQNVKTAAPDDENQTVTRYGQLSIVGDLNNMQLMFNGKKLRDGDGFSLSFEKKLVSGNSDIILIMNNSGGRLCPVQYFFVTVKSESDVQLSPEFGTCSDLIKISQNGEQVIATMPDYSSGKKVKYAYIGGVVTENGVPIK